MRGLTSILAAGIAALIWMTPAIADQSNPDLDGLFERLHETDDSEEARALESQIWVIWMSSEHAAAETLIEEGTLLMQLGRFGGALEAFNTLVESYPDIAEGWNKRATLHYLMGEFDLSVSDIQETLVREPRHFGALSGLGLINMALEREEQAVDAFEAALRINPHLRGVKINLKEVRERLKKKEI